MAIYIKAPAKGCPTCDSCAADVPCPAPAITSSLGPISETINVYFEYQITASGNPTSFGATGLPTGLNINTSTGLISGAITSCGTVNIGITATNSCGTSPNKGVSFVVTGPSPSITSASKVIVFVGDYFSYYITATNSPTSFSCINLPSWASFNNTTGQIYGTVGSDIDYNIELFATNSCGTGTGSVVLYSANQPQLLCDSISAVGYKYGFVEWPGHVSSPPKIYRKLAPTGTMYEYSYSSTSTDCSGDVEYTGENAFGGSQQYDYYGSLIVDAITVNGTYVAGWSEALVPCYAAECVPVVTSTTETFVGDEICYSEYPSFKYAGTVVATLSEEYTTDDLFAATIAILPSYPNTWDGTCMAFRDLESDELTYSIMRFKYKFTLPNLTGFTTFQITWMEGSTPRTYTWNHVDTETPVYTVLEPSTNGSIVITDVEPSGT